MTLVGRHILVLGGGTIGAGWAVAFAGSGAMVSVVDPNPECRNTIETTFEAALPVMRDLKLCVEHPTMPVYCPSLDALESAADYVQEALPERLALKQMAIGELESRIADDVIIASSSSGLAASDIQDGMRHPHRLVIAHPCNPPYLMPVVEICGGAQTAAESLDAADALYAGMGKTVLRLHQELPGHLVNRLQAALWREAVHLAATGAASVEDIERAVTQGLGPRWAVVGPTTIFHLSGGVDGLPKFFEDLGDEMERWWASLGTPSLDDETRKRLVAGMESANGDRQNAEIAARRDRLVPRVISVVRDDLAR